MFTSFSRSVSSSTLSLMLSWQARVSQPSGTFSVFVSTNGLPRSTWRDNLFVKRIYIDLLGTGRFSSILHGSRVSSDKGLPRSVTTWVWNWLVRLETSRLLHNLSLWSLSMFWSQISFPIVSQRDHRWKPKWHVNFYVYDFSNFHPDNFRNTIKLEMFHEEKLRSISSDRTSILSFKQDWCRPNTLRPDVFSMLCAWRDSLKSIVSRSLCLLSLGSTKRKNTVCLLFKFWPPSIHPELMMDCKLIAHPTW